MTRTARTTITCAAVALLALASPPLVAPALADSTVTVNTTNSASPSGDGLCSLPEAVAYADGSSEPDCSATRAAGTTTIVLPASSVAYTLTSTLVLSAPAVIDGAGASDTVISGGNAVQVLRIPQSGTLTVSGVTITEGLSGNSTAGCTTVGRERVCPAEEGLIGGGIYNVGTLTLVGDAISKNHASDGIGPTGQTACGLIGCAGASSESGGSGGGIFNFGKLTIDDCTITGNSAGAGGNGTEGTTASGGGPGEEGGNGSFGGYGGGIYNDVQGELRIADSTISGNAAGAGGDAGKGSSATTAPDDGGNAGTAGAGGNGGGIFSDGSMTVTGSTVSGNQAGAGGAGAASGAGTGGGLSGASSGGGAGGSGGGIDAQGTDTITNSTLTGNIAAAGGAGGPSRPAGAGGSGGALDLLGGEVTFTFDTVADNVGGSEGSQLSMRGPGAEIYLGESIVAALAGGSNPSCSPLIASFGANVDYGDPTNSCPGEHVDPNLEPLADNGGPTQTMALGPGSGAIGLVPSASCTVATDQRGVSRPQNGVCDAGAYQNAPPAITSPGATAISSSAGLVSAEINPNFSAQHTVVTVEYGTTPAYGSNSQPQDIGGGDAPVTFAAALSGLTARTTYYAEVLATNADGTTTASAGTFTTPAQAATIASGTGTPTPGGGSTKTASGSKTTPTIRAKVRVQWAPGKHLTALERLTLSGLPAGARVELICNGGGCPFPRRSFMPRHGALALAEAFKHRRLRPKATLELEIAAPGDIGEVIVFTVRSGRPPRTQERCLPPGASSSAACG